MADKIEEYRHSTLGEQVYLRKIFRAAVNLIDDPLIIFDKLRQKLLLNKSAYELFNLSQDIEITYEKAKDFFPKSVWLLLQQSSQKASAGIGLKNKEFSVINNKIMKPDEAIDITLLMFKDNAKIDLKGFIKLEKIADVLEDLLLPLTRIHLAIHICLEKSLGTLTLKQEEFLSSARSDCYKMRKMISNIQNLQKLEDITALAEKSAVSLPMVLQECVKDMEVFAQAKNVKMVMDFPPMLEDIDANKNQLALVINNLIDNAIYHSESGGTIKIRIKENKSRVFFLIHNLGSFIPKEFKTRIFEKYFQLPGDKSEREGLGLYIAKRIIEEHNGTIWVRSTAKSGTTFCFSVPKKRG
jgi:signal transduction histidine kinase